MPDILRSQLQKYLSQVRLRPDDPEARMGLGMAYDEIGNVADAYKEYDAVLHLNPDHPKAMLLIAFGYVQHMDYTKAFATWHKALKLNPVLQKHFSEPNSFYRKKIEHALSIFERAVTLAPDDSYAHFHLACAYRLFNRNEIALQEFQKTIDLNPKMPESYAEAGQILSQMGQNQLAIKYLQKAQQLNPAVASFHYNLALIYEKEGMLGTALIALQKAIALDAKDSSYHFAEGNLYMKQGKYTHAIKSFQTALDLDQHNALAHFNLAKACEAIFKPEFAVLEYEKTIQLSPENTEAYYNLGQVYIQTGNLGKAIPLLEEVIKRNAGDAYAHYNLGTIYQRLGNIEKALSHLNIAANLNPKDAYAHYNLAQIYDNAGQLELAIGEYKAALEVKPTDIHYHLALARDYRLRKDYASEIEHLNKILLIDLTNQEVLIMLAKALINNHQADKAIDTMEKLQHLNPQSADAHYYTGLAILEKDDIEDAVEEFKRAIFLDPKHHLALQGMANIHRKSFQNEAAIDYLKQAVAIKPDFIPGHFDLFNLYLELAFLEQAEQEMAQIIKYEPDNPEYLHPYSRVLYTRGKFNESAENLQKLIALQDTAENRLLMGRIYQELGKNDLAMAQFQKGRQQDPQNVDISLAIAELYQKLGRYKKALEEYRLVLQNHPENEDAKNALTEMEYLKDTVTEEEAGEITVEKIFTDAVMLYIRTRFQEAGELLQKALEMDPEYYPALYYHGVIAKLNKKLNEAERIFSQGLQLAQTAKDQQYQLMFNTELTSLKKDLTAATEPQSEVPSPSTLAEAEIKTEPETVPEEALTSAQAEEEIALFADMPAEGSTVQLLENSSEQLEEEDILEALEMAESLSEVTSPEIPSQESEIIPEPEVPEALPEILGTTTSPAELPLPKIPEEADLDTIPAAPTAEEIPAATAETPETPASPADSKDLLTQARNWFAQEKYDRTKARLQELLAGEGENQEALSLMAEVSMRQGDCPNALKYWENLLDLNGDASLYHRLAEGWEKLGEYKKALGYYEKIRENDKDNFELALKAAQIYRQTGENKKTLAIYQSLLETHPQDLELRISLGETLETLKKNSLAVIQYQKALELAPQDTQILEKLGGAYLRLDKGEWARKAYHRLLEIQETNFAAHQGMLEALKLLDKPANALAYYKEILGHSWLDKEAKDKFSRKYTELFGPLRSEESKAEGKKPAKQKAQKAKNGKAAPAGKTAKEPKKDKKESKKKE